MSKQLRPLFSALCGAAVLVLAGCGSADVGPTGTTCPTGGTQLTAENFGNNFFTTYCTRCHSSELSGIFQRHGAPPPMNFNTHAGVKEWSKNIDAWAGAGPDRVNTEMPGGNPEPSEDDRRKLSEWLACGAP
ncbi:hypothetical protein [Archangium sp.]|uniref:hypothetical protein n=1 Tax=Archangium sp. TaxID=1872627 RepID=UPI00286D0671|nr:hypothetical protein [Archangium sp.]